MGTNVSFPPLSLVLLVALSHILVQVGSVLLMYITLLKLETWPKGYYILTAGRPHDSNMEVEGAEVVSIESII